ncbi:aminotransferase class III-fold pyridoxal phosphate-dependent enzyme [Streptomyces xanthophaeus]|uniref:aminotransferase class III-fold pyridoxal phosphate-dependent enzyme n=1 Tax=Streptomyces xanthophaeus TaxID=67385 RepID=UPI0039900112
MRLISDRSVNRRILDGSSGLLCTNVGQSSPAVLARIERQYAKSTFGGAAVVQPHVQVELMDRLCRPAGRPEHSVALTTCGTLGVEVVVGLARNIVRVGDGKRRGDILTSSLSYRGNNMFTLGVAGNQIRNPRPEDRYGLGPAFPAPYPPTHGHANEGLGCDASCADEVAQTIDSRGTENVAGVLTGTPLASHHWDGCEPALVILSQGLGAGYVPLRAFPPPPVPGRREAGPLLCQDCFSRPQVSALPTRQT